MEIEFDEGTFLLRDGPETIPQREWIGRVDERRVQAHRYRSLLDRAGGLTDGEAQTTLQYGFTDTVKEATRRIRLSM